MSAALPVTALFFFFFCPLRRESVCCVLERRLSFSLNTLFKYQFKMWIMRALWKTSGLLMLLHTVRGHQWTMTFSPKWSKSDLLSAGNRLQTSYQQGLAVAKRRGGEGGARELSFNCVKLAGYLRASVRRHDASAFTRSPTRLRS